MPTLIKPEIKAPQVSDQPYAWMLGEWVGDDDPESWVRWSHKLDHLIKRRLNLSQSGFAKLMGVSRPTVSKWLNGSPMQWDAQNIFSNLVFLIESRGPALAMKLIGENRDHFRNIAPDQFHIEEIQSVKVRLDAVEARCRALEGLHERMERKVRDVETAILRGPEKLASYL